MLLVIGLLVLSILMIAFGLMAVGADDSHTYDRVSAGNGENHDGYYERRI